MPAIIREYTITFDAVAVAAAQDLFYVKAGASNGLRFKRCIISATGVTSLAEVRIRIKRLPATVTAGSGGSSVTTINKVHSLNQFSAASTCRSNDTSQATTSGTAVILSEVYWQLASPWDESPTNIEDMFETTLSEALVIDIAAPGSSTTMNGTLYFEET